MSKTSNKQSFGCETCAIRQKAEANPNTLMARLWRWHTGWCPGWKAYQTYLAEKASAEANLDQNTRIA